MPTAFLVLMSPLNTLIVIRSYLKDVFLRYIEQKEIRKSLWLWDFPDEYSAMSPHVIVDMTQHIYAYRVV